MTCSRAKFTFAFICLKLVELLHLNSLHVDKDVSFVRVAVTKTFVTMENATRLSIIIIKYFQLFL